MNILSGSLQKGLSCDFLSDNKPNLGIKSNDDKYIFLFGTSTINDHKSIHFMDTNTRNIKTSKLLNPFGKKGMNIGDIHAVIPKNDLRVNGYVKNLWNGKKFDNIRYPPHYLLQIIVKYYSKNGVIYLFRGNDMVRLNIDDILEENTDKKLCSPN